MFRLEVLPAAHGDALWIEYGDPETPRRIVVDGGPAASYENGLHKRILMLPQKDRRIDLLVVTHIDADHIDGAIILLRAADKMGVEIGEVWFNGWSQISREQEAAEGLKPLQGEFLDALLQMAERRKRWNVSAKGRSVRTGDDGEPPVWRLPGRARATILSPGLSQIKRLRARWMSALREFSPGNAEEALRRLERRQEYRPPPPVPVFGAADAHGFGNDRSFANGSSIAFLLECEGATCLLAGDAHPRVLASSIRRLISGGAAGPGARLRLDAFKLPHHGSMSNLSEELLSAVECRRWIVSTNGAIYNHPDSAIAAFVAQTSRKPPEFFCNYESETTKKLAGEPAETRWRVAYPGKGAEVGPAGGIVVDLSPKPNRRGASAKTG